MTYGFGEMSFEEFQRGCHLGYQFEFHVPIPATRIQFNTTYGLGENALKFRDSCQSGDLGSQNGTILAKIVSEYDQEIPQSQTADKPMAPRGRATQLSIILNAICWPDAS